MRILLRSDKEKLSEDGNAAKSNNYKRPEKIKTMPRFTHEFSLCSVAISKTTQKKKEKETKRDVRCLRGAEANTHTQYIYVKENEEK